MHVGASSVIAPELPRVGGGTPAPPRAGGTAFADMLRETSTVADAGPTKLVASTRTKLTPTEAKAALSQAWESRFGEPPSDETAAILTAQWAHETGHGQSMFNFNFAGIKGSGPSGMSVSQRTREGYGASERVIVDKFRAYESPEEGASDYLSLLARRYGPALEAANQGKPAEFVKALRQGGYFTGSEAAYTKSVTTLTASFLGRTPEASPDKAMPEAVASLNEPPPRGPVPTSVPLSDRLEPSIHARPASSTFARVSEKRERAPATALSLPSVEMFHDALSRAALRIALDPEHHEENS